MFTGPHTLTCTCVCVCVIAPGTQPQRDENKFIFMLTFQCIHLLTLYLYVNMQFFLISWLSPPLSFISSLPPFLPPPLSLSVIHGLDRG